MGGLQKRSRINAQGKWDPTAGAISFEETYRFDDGFVGEEPRPDGKAEAEQAGCAFNWRYTRETPQPDSSSIELNFDDWFYDR